MGFKLFVSIWLVFIVLNPQEIQCMNSENCWTWQWMKEWAKSEDYEGYRIRNNSVITLYSLTEHFGMGCNTFNEANCILTHTQQGLVSNSHTNCIASENGTPCTEDRRIIFEKTPVSCIVTFTHFKNEDLGKWAMIQGHEVKEFEFKN